MRLPYSSLKTGIFIILVIILLAAMILLDMVVISMVEKDMVRLEIQNGLMILKSIEEEIRSVSNKEGFNHAPYKRLQYLVDKKHLVSAIILNPNGEIIFETETGKVGRKKLLAMAKESIKSGENTFSAPSLSWGILQPHNEYCFMAYPMMYKEKAMAAAAVKMSLENIFRDIRQFHKIIFFYICLNTLFFGLLGFYFIYRIVVRPINRLVRKSEEFKEGEIFYPFPTAEQNEFGKLSRAITMMLERLENNRAELKKNIDALEKTNLDLTKAQDDIVRSEKLASVGRLASGIAHEIGNPIGTIFGYLGLLKDSNDKGERIDFIGRIEGEIERINRTIRDLLDFSRPSKDILEQVSLHSVISEVVDMLKPQKIMSGITVNLDLKANEDIVLADPDKMKQLFLNIVMNAIDAMDVEQGVSISDDKRLSIKTSAMNGADSHMRERENRIHIECIDSGQGISHEELGRIFDPFFTTKEPGKGTGLGLSVSLRIVEDMGGEINVKSKVGKGTTVSIILPLHRDV